MRLFGDPGTGEQAGDVVRMGVNDRAGLRAQETREGSSIGCRGMDACFTACLWKTALVQRHATWTR
jgi:hypothetical protein